MYMFQIHDHIEKFANIIFFKAILIDVYLLLLYEVSNFIEFGIVRLDC